MPAATADAIAESTTGSPHEGHADEQTDEPEVVGMAGGLGLGLDQFSIRQNRFGFEPEVTAKIARRGYRITELPVRYNARDWDEGKKIGMHDAFEALFCIVRYAWRD